MYHAYLDEVENVIVGEIGSTVIHKLLAGCARDPATDMFVCVEGLTF
jgi:hypothetical protein